MASCYVSSTKSNNIARILMELASCYVWCELMLLRQNLILTSQLLIFWYNLWYSTRHDFLYEILLYTERNWRMAILLYVALFSLSCHCNLDRTFRVLIQDYRIAERIEREGKGCVIVVNKWDTIPNKNHQTTAFYEQDVREKLRILDWAPIVYATAISGHSVDK